MEQILITRANTTVELINSSSTITSIISAEHRKAALGEDVVVMSVEMAVDRAFSIGDSIKLFGGNTYKINQLPSAEKISERQFKYDLVFEGIQYDLLRVLYRNEDVSSFSTSSEFSLTGDIEMFLNVLINNANRTFGAGKWALGEFPSNTETKNLLFSNENCLTVLQRICAEYSYEFTFTETSTQKILNVKNAGTELGYTFEYGKGKGLYNLKRDSVDSKKIINKLFVYGSTKNIPANYKNYSQRLHFGTVSPFTESVVSDSASIAAFGVCEGSIIFDDVFPTGYNSITSINTSNRLEFTDTSMSFDLNAKDGSGNTLYLIPGVTAKVHFNSGNLAGYEFEIEKYTHATKKFVLKAVTDEKGLSFPSLTESAFQLSIGDTYSLIDVIMPQSLIDAAESLLQSKGVDYLNENKNPIVKYSISIDEAYLKSLTTDLNIFDVGDSVVIKDSDFNINTRIKIISFSRDVLNPYRYSIVVSDVPEISILRSLAIKSSDAERIIRHNGFNDPIKFKQDPNSNNQIQSQIDETINRKPSVIIGRDSDNISLGNKENQTLTEILGRLGMANSIFYDRSFTNDDGSILPMLGLDTYDFFLHGDFELGGKLSVQSGVLEMGTKDYNATLQAAYISSPNNKLLLESTKGIEARGDFSVGKIQGLGAANVLADSTWQFIQPVLGVDGTNPASFITRNHFDSVIVALATGLGNIRVYPAVRACTNANITLLGTQTVDSVALNVDDKVLVKNQTDATQNYIYVVKSGAWERVTDLPNNSIKGLQVQILEGGIVNKGGIFINTNAEAEEDIIVGTTAITFVQSFHNIGNPYMASLAANDQVFYGTNKFLEKLEVRTPLSATEATNKIYVDTQVNALSSTVSATYWSKISNYGIGTTTNNGLNFYANNAKRAELTTGGRLTGLAGININDGAFTQAFSTNYPTYYGLTSNKSIYVGSVGGSTASLNSVDLVRGSNTGNRSGIRLGSYNAAGGIANFFYGIEYSTAGKLSIGYYSSSAMDGTNTSLDASKVTAYDSSGNWSFGSVTATERVDITGNIKVSGVYKPSGNAPAAGNMFLVSDGTTANKYMNFGEFGQFQTHGQFATIDALPWGASFVDGGTGSGLPTGLTQAHVIKMSIGSEYLDQATYIAFGRPFGSYWDKKLYLGGDYNTGSIEWLEIGAGEIKDFVFEEGEILVQYQGVYYNIEQGGKEGFFGIDKINGGFTMNFDFTDINSNVVTRYRNFMGEDGRLYYQINSSPAIKYLLEDEGGSGGGVAYTPSEPITIIGNQIGVRTASASQIGVLTAADWTAFNNKQNALSNASASVSGILTNTDWSIFNNKLGQGSTVSSFLNYASNAVLYFDRVGASSDARGKIFIENRDEGADPDFVISAKGVDTDIYLLTDASIKMKSSNVSNSGVIGVEVEIGTAVSNSRVKIHGNNFKMMLDAAPVNNQKYCFQYRASDGTFFLTTV